MSGSAHSGRVCDVATGVELHWLDGVPAASTGTSWGVPWPRGQVSQDASFSLTAANGAPVPVQSWPLAYWPDSSLKWTGHAVSSTVPESETFTLRLDAPAPPVQPVAVVKSGGEVRLTNGSLEVHLAADGPFVLRSISRCGRSVAENGRLVLLLQDQPEDDGARWTSWSGVVDSADIEQRGPVRAVVKLAGRYQHDGLGDKRAILPWTLRVYVGAGDRSIRLVHHFMWDADVNHDFVRGLGMQLSIPLFDEAHNRHIRFSTASGGVWGEPVRILTGLRRDPGWAVRSAQVAGTATPPLAQWDPHVRDGYQQLAVWNDFTLFQESSRHFSVWKRTSPSSSWLRHAGHGDRAAGFGYVGGPSGGLGFALTDFWQRFPRSLDVRGAGGDIATVTLWSWSPHAAAMDLRHYDTVAHGLDLAYEDVQEGFSTPEGIGRSTEMTLWAFDTTPSRDDIVALSTTHTVPPQLVAEPSCYKAAGIFGRWSLADHSTPARRALEDSIERDLAFYASQVDQRNWYGFWHYGDVMHTYDADRHEWRYDIGGYAWDNAELGIDAALWYAFLRSGKPTIFRLARAMTHHVSEVDTHHRGRFAGLGARHNVVNWGDGAKEARIAESFTRRFAYYLTTDELVGDLIRSSLQADTTLLGVQPLRMLLPPQSTAPTRLRIGPDWYALVSNWLTEWERTGDTRWRDRIVTGMKDVASFPAGLFTGEAGGAVGFDPQTAHLTNLERGDYTGGYKLAMAFCGDQIMWEALDLIDVPEFRATYLDFARYVQAPPAERIARYGFDFDPAVFRTISSRLTAWAGEQLKDPAIRQRGWDQFTSDPAGQPWPAAVTVTGNVVTSPVNEIPSRNSANPSGDFASVSTNEAAQRILAIIALLAIAPQEAP